MVQLQPIYSPATMADLLSALPEQAHILDLGCGGGSFSYTSFPAFTIDALDEFAAPLTPFPPHVHYRQGQAERLPYADRSFHLVISNFVMEHVGDFDASIDEVSRVLKPGGYFYMSVPNARSFEDALYRGIYNGGGHLQRHSFESVVGTVYARTPLKLLAYLEWPGGFTFLQDREALRTLTSRIVEACREGLGVDIRARSNYIFVFQMGDGLGRPQTAAVCGYCGGGVSAEISAEEDWICPNCGRHNGTRGRHAVTDEQLDADMRALWERHPHLRPTTPVPSAASPVTLTSPPQPQPESSAKGDLPDDALTMVPPAVTAAELPRVRASEEDLVRRVRLALRMLRRGHI